MCSTSPEGRATARAAGAATTTQTTAPRYARHVSERTLLYALVQAHYADFLARLEAEDRSLPAYVREEIEAFLRCSALDHGFLRVVCELCHADKFAWSEFEQPQAGPKGGGQEARSTNSPGANLNSRRLARRAEGRKPGVQIRLERI